MEKPDGKDQRNSTSRQTKRDGMNGIRIARKVIRAISFTKGDIFVHCVFYTELVSVFIRERGK